MKNYTRFTTEQILQCRFDKNLMEALIKNTHAMVYKQARRYHIKDLELEDLISIGQVEVYKAVHTYKQELNVDFYTYATTCIMNKYRKLFVDSKAKKRGGLGANATEEEIENEELLVKRVVSLDRMSEEGESILDKLQSSTNVYYEGTNFEGWDFLIQKKILQKRELHILQRVYVYDHTLTDIAQEWGVTRQNINKVHKRALGKIKEYYNKQQLATLLGV